MIKISLSVIWACMAFSACETLSPNASTEKTNPPPLTSAPPKTPSTTSPTTVPTTTPDSPPPPTPPSTVMDKTPHPPLATVLPALNNAAGWRKITSTAIAAIPPTAPNPPKIFWSAQKNINGIDRTISVVHGDLLKESDAIVNAANSGLEGGGGIDGAIHNAALVGGKDLLKDEAIAYKNYYKITAFPTGSAMVMHPYGLGPAIKMIIFTAGPQGASTLEKDLELCSAVLNSLSKASEYGAKSVSIPTISTGIYGFPLPRAIDLYYGAALQFFAHHPTTSIEHVRFIDLPRNKIQSLGTKFDLLFP